MTLNMIYVIENTFWLKKYNPWMMRLQRFMGIRSLATQIQSSFNKSYIATSCSCGCKSLYNYSTLSLSFMSTKMKAFRSYLKIFIWQRSLTIEIPEMPCTGEIMSLSPRKLETVWPFLECIITKSFDNVNFVGSNFKFAMLIKSHRSWFILFQWQSFFNQVVKGGRIFWGG